jgi:hypothetical protein
LPKKEEESQEREEEESQESIVSQDEEPADDKIIPRRVWSLPKWLAGIFGGCHGNKTNKAASVESTPLTAIQNAMSEEKEIEKAISNGNMMALEANLNTEAASITPAQKPRLIMHPRRPSFSSGARRAIISAADRDRLKYPTTFTCRQSIRKEIQWMSKRTISQSFLSRKLMI